MEERAGERRHVWTEAGAMFHQIGPQANVELCLPRETNDLAVTPPAERGIREVIQKLWCYEKKSTT
jgi:hypothetical protein